MGGREDFAPEEMHVLLYLRGATVGGGKVATVGWTI